MKMKKIAILSLIVLAMAIPAYAQTVEDVMNRAMNAMGGKGKLESLDTMTLTMKGSMMGSEMNMNMYRKAPDMMRIDMVVMGMSIIQATDGTDYWQSQMGTVMDMDDNSKKQFKQSFAQMTGGNLQMMQEMGAKLTYGGKATMDGIAADVIDMVMEAEGMNAKMYFSAADGLPFRMDMSTPMGEVNMLIKDYRDVGGIKMAHSIEMLMGGSPMMTMNIDKVEMNQPVDLSLFKRP